MKKIKKHFEKKYISLVSRAGMVMTIIVTLALASLMSSMFVSESLDGSAAQINIAGSLRMQSIRLSRALITEQNNLTINQALKVEEEVLEFERRLKLLINHGLITKGKNTKIASNYQLLEKQWLAIKNKINDNPTFFSNDYSMIDAFVETIDQLVTKLQLDSERKIRILRIIQGSALFLTLLTAFVSLYRINKLIVQPMNNLVNAAKEAGKGNFSIKIKSRSNDEIGLLAGTFNHMSQQLQIMHKRFEDRVTQKTFKLQQSNKSLELLYQTSHNLVRPNKQKDFEDLLKKVEDNLGVGRLILCLENDKSKKTGDLLKPISIHDISDDCKKLDCNNCTTPSHKKHIFTIEKQNQRFGKLQYITDNVVSLEPWQTHLLQTITDNIAIAISLDKKRSQENLLLLMEERAVIARELHDSLAQSLSYLKLQTSILSKQIEKDVTNNKVNNIIIDLKEGLNNAYRQLRELLTTFRLEIDEPSLESALKSTTTEFSVKCDHPIELNYQIPDTLLSSNEQIHVLQIVREALSNVQRHAQANHAQVKVQQFDDQVKVEIVDDGIGLPEQMPDGSHYGLSIMSERAQSLKAKMDLINNSNSGTLVSISFTPISHNSQNHNQVNDNQTSHNQEKAS